MNIDKVIKLAHLEVKPDEVKGLEKDLSTIISAFEAIKEVNTQNIRPLISPITLKQHLRKDQAMVTENIAEVLERAPEIMGKLFKTPPVI